MHDPVYSFITHGESTLGALIPDEESDAPQNPNVVMVEIMNYLSSRRHSAPVSIAEINKLIHADLEEDYRSVLQKLRSNPKVLVEGGEYGIPLTLQHVDKFEARGRVELKRIVETERGGVSREDVKNTYDDALDDIGDLLRSTELIGLKNPEKKDCVLFPRGKQFLVRMSGTVTVTRRSFTLQTTTDLRPEIRRGDAIRVGDYWFRVSSQVNAKGNQPARAQAPSSVSSIDEMSSKNTYIYQFTHDHLPLDMEFDADGDFEGPALKHGCTNDIREMWAQTLKEVPETDLELQQKLVSRNLVTKLATKPLRPIVRTKQEKKKRKRKDREIRHMTNTHLQGTAQFAEVMSEAGKKY
jgi:hypothetical protein